MEKELDILKIIEACGTKRKAAGELDNYIVKPLAEKKIDSHYCCLSTLIDRILSEKNEVCQGSWNDYLS